MQKSPTAVICLSPYSGGMEINSIKMLTKLSPYTRTILIAKKDHFIANEVKTKNLDFEVETISFRSNLSFSIIFQARNIIKKHGIKNVIFFGASELKSLYFAFLGLDINLVIMHGTTKSTPKKDWFHRMIYSDVNYHVTICEHLSKNVRKIIPFGKNTKLKRIYSSIDFEDIKAITSTNSPLEIIHIGRIARAKGQIDAMKACEVLHKNNIAFRLTLIGGMAPDYEEYFNNTLNTFAYKESIRLTGHISDIHNYYAHADIFLFPSSGEGLSNSFIEALAYGLSCISYENTSFPELQELGFYFHMAKHEDVEDLKQVLLDTANNIEGEHRLSVKNVALAKKMFSKEQEIRKYLEVLV